MGQKALMIARRLILQPRRNNVCVLLLFCGLCFSFSANAMDVVLAFTNVQARATSLDGATRAKLIINHLKRLDVGPVAVLVRTHEVTPKTEARIALYDKAGHMLVNHGRRQHLLSRPDLYRYQADLLAANMRLRAYSNYRGHVYLANFENETNISNRQKLVSFSRAKMLTPIYVSVQVQDAYMNQRYQRMVNNNRRVDMAALQNAYVDMIWQQMMVYDAALLTTYPRAPLVLLLEEHDLTAYFLPGLIDRIRERGGRIVAPQSIFTNPPVYAMPTNVHTPEGYFAALIGGEPPRLVTPLVVGGNKNWFDTYLGANNLLQLQP
jgi:hypothetical protein